MFRLGVMTDEISQDFAYAVRVCQEYKLQTVEIRSAWDKPPQELADKDVAEIARILEPTGMKVSNIASPFYKCDIDDEAAVKEHHRILARCIEVGRKLGSNIIRGFTFWNTGRTEEVWGKILELYEKPVQIAAEADAIIAIENEAATSLATARLLQRFLADLDAPNVKALWDPANEVFADGGERPFPEAFRRIEKEMVHFHLKDARRNEDTGQPECTPVGEGVIDWQGQLADLLASGYAGAVSLETHWRPQALTEEQLNRPGGAAFSESGEYASRLCLDNLMRIMKQVAG
ncbi:MAG: sugar phosphate isomerase/epimerase [Armatimonadota bacterium]|nr:MAG: sugar phosphate isomerase/epimerase [Armatimonadota bacterium]